MQSIIQLNKEIFGMKFPWNLWVMLLGGVNMIGGLWFIHTFEGIFALACLVEAFVIMWFIYIKKGFVRLLGLGHLVAWTPLMIWFARTAIQSETEGTFLYWLCAVLTLNGISLMIDLVDVIRYYRGETQPING